MTQGFLIPKLMLRNFAEFLLEFAASGWGPAVMVAHAFLESFILPLAHELFLIPVSLARPNLSLVFALMSTIASTLGITVGYFLGKRGGRKLLLWMVKPKLLALAKKQINKYDTWAVAIACFTPIPVKVFALVAGAARLNLKKMIPIAFISRGARFFLVCLLLYFYGQTVREWILDYMEWVMIGLLLFMVASVLLWKYVTQWLLKKEHLA